MAWALATIDTVRAGGQSYPCVVTRTRLGKAWLRRVEE